MFGIGMPEMILILAVALIVIGPKKLPDLAKSLGKAMGEFKKATSDLKDSMQIDTELKDVKDAFNDINRDDKKEPQIVTSEEEMSVEAGGPEDTPEAVKPADGVDDAMDNLKAAFDRQSTDTSEFDGKASVDSDAPVADAEPNVETRKE
jgi:sec-independent protein translocase protein TatB